MSAATSTDCYREAHSGRTSLMLRIAALCVVSIGWGAAAEPSVYQLFPGKPSERIVITESPLTETPAEFNSVGERLDAGEPFSVEGCSERPDLICITDGGPIRFAVPRDESNIHGSWTVRGREFRVTLPLHKATYLGRTATYCQISLFEKVTGIHGEEGGVYDAEVTFLYSPEFGLIMQSTQASLMYEYETWVLASKYGFAAQRNRTR